MLPPYCCTADGCHAECYSAIPVSKDRLYTIAQRRRPLCSSLGELLHIWTDFGIPTVPWSVDVNDHWHLARDALQTQAKMAFPFEKRVRRQQYFDQDAWNAMCHRKALRQEHRAAQREMDGCILRFFFKAWKHGHMSDEDAQEGLFQLHVLRMQDALFVHQRRQCDERFRVRKRQAWKQWALDNAERIRKDLLHGDVFVS